MMIKNLTKKTVLTKKTRLCRSVFSKAVGLMFSSGLDDKSIVFVFGREKTVSLHMLFVLFPIDVIFLNKSKKVVEIKENLRPWSFYVPRNKAIYVVEAPAGTARKSSTAVGDRIGF